MLLSGYLSWTALGGEHVKGCSVGSGCDIVLNSPWATLMGLPTALWGFFAYTLLACIAFVSRVDRHWQYAWTLSLFSVAYSAYLTTISLTVLHATCPYCLTSLALATTIFVLVTWQRPSTLPSFSWPKWLSRTVPIAAVLIAGLHLNYVGVTGADPAREDPLASALADHLKQSGVKFYGASWCPHCQEQKKLFGPAAARLPYIECSTGGYGTPETEICKAENIKQYPTWEINGKRYEAVMTLQDLAGLTGFKAPPTPTN
jgi:uncharacterized membrane protein/glutaredoxin